mmetsp:Transcript_57920/g.131248  ORF Transcript_57920/g.131248 Transcript_57920/m.131248 type:complete len:217 (+) Transcript_57920:653-1303(+)
MSRLQGCCRSTLALPTKLGKAANRHGGRRPKTSHPLWLFLAAKILNFGLIERGTRPHFLGTMSLFLTGRHIQPTSGTGPPRIFSRASSCSSSKLGHLLHSSCGLPASRREAEWRPTTFAGKLITPTCLLPSPRCLAIGPTALHLRTATLKIAFRKRTCVPFPSRESVRNRTGARPCPSLPSKPRGSTAVDGDCTWKSLKSLLVHPRVVVARRSCPI